MGSTFIADACSYLRAIEMFWDLKTEIVCLRAGAPGLCRYRCGVEGEMDG